MNRDEFREWVENFMAVFPDSKAWLQGLDSEAKPALYNAWVLALEDVTLEDAKAVTLRIVCGDDPAIPAYQRELTASHVRKLAKEHAARRRERDQRSRGHANPDVRDRVGDGPTAGGMFRAIMDKVQAGMSPREAASSVIPAVDPSAGPRYDCRLCQDSGIVLIWSARSMSAALAGKLDERINRACCGTPCSCQRGREKVWTGSEPPRGWRGWTDAEAIYDPARHCLCPHGDTDAPESISRFKEWCAEQMILAEKKGRVAAFDEWNQSQGAF